MKLLALVVPVLFSSFAMGSIAYDANLVPPGWYNGTGPVNGGFTVDTENGVELGLRAKERQSATVIDSLTDLYLVQPGAEPGVPNRAWWNWDFSLNLESSGLNLADVTLALTVTDLTNPASGNITNLLTFFGDNSLNGTIGAQNSENPIFGSFPLAGSYNEFSPDTYEFDVTLTQNSNSAVLATDTILVQVAPEPGSIAFIASGLAGLLLLGRRFRHIQKDIL